MLRFNYGYSFSSNHSKTGPFKPDAQKIGNGIYSVKMKINRPIPNFLPCLGLKIRICYKGCILLCPNCYRVHPRGTCKNAKLTWIGYVNRFIENNPKLDAEAYGRWWPFLQREFPKSDTVPSYFCKLLHKQLPRSLPNNVILIYAIVP